MKSCILLYCKGVSPQSQYAEIFSDMRYLSVRAASFSFLFQTMYLTAEPSSGEQPLTGDLAPSTVYSARNSTCFKHAFVSIF